jgi:Tfp pilus assembly protein PilF
MSLLMQALKKAEHIKQKQSGIAPDEALTLSPKELVATPEIVEIAEATPEQNKLESAVSTLTLSPHMDEKSAELVSAEVDVAKDVVKVDAASSTVSPVIPLPEVVIAHQAIAATNFDTGTIENKPVPDAANATSVSVAHGEAEAKNINRPEMPKIGTEQKLAAEQAGKILLSEQNRAKSVFSAKAPQSNQRRMRIGIYTSLSLLVVAVIAYLYWQSMSVGLESSILRTPPPLPVASPMPMPEPEAPAKVDVNAVAPVPGSNASQASIMNANGATAAPSNSAPVTPVSHGVKLNANAVNAGAETAPPVTTSATSAKVKMAPATPIEDSNAIQIRRNSSGNQVNPALSSAYQYFISGDAVAAKLQYQKVLQQEPNNRDALLGMAAIALNQRQAEQAGSFYGRLLELDPADPDAIAGLTSLQQGDPVQSESRLKKSLSQHPQAGAVLFALGNLYAQQSRWSDAQQTYFKAYTTTPGSADYAFNLAVSLDKLNQVKLAREYYQRALKLGQNSSGNFSRNDVQKRVAELEAIAQE